VQIGITGATGFVGTALQKAIHERGWTPVPITRSKRKEGILWDPSHGFENLSQLEKLDAVVHLGGASLFGLWTQRRRRAILESRREATATLAKALASLSRGPRVLVSASAIGYYGDSGDEWVGINHPSGDTFLAEVCRVWEQATSPAEEAGIRVIHPRFGMILHPSGGALATMIPAFRYGLGAIFGSGKQWVSWIGLDDCVELICLSIERQEMRGALNAVAPHPVTNQTLSLALASALKRPCWLRIPAPLVRACLGDFGQEILLSSCRAKSLCPHHPQFTWKADVINKIFLMI
jgi:uncharacterized protein